MGSEILPKSPKASPQGNPKAPKAPTAHKDPKDTEANKATKAHAFHLVQKATIGDWFMYFLISRNMDSHTYNIFIQEITEKFKTKA